MNHSFELKQVEELGGIVGRPGWFHLKNAIVEKYLAENHVERMSGDAFKDGQLKGGVERIKEIIQFLESIEKLVMQQQEDEDARSGEA